MSPHDIWLEAVSRGLRLEANGDKLRVCPPGACPPDFKAVLLEHKQELLEWLSSPPSGPAFDLPGAEILDGWPDGKPTRRQRGGSFGQWLHTSKQILAGEFGNANENLKESLAIGLRSYAWHPAVQRALKRLGK
jgi:TubC N-terminal docking domain